MKKTLLAAALLAGFATAGVAQAETSVTLYGILDTGYGYSQFKYDKDNTKGRVNHSGMTGGVVNGSRWGMRGSEDLGDGLRAIFTLEAGIDLGTGNSNTDRMFHRQSFIGLSSDNWGTFTMGRQYSPSVTTNVANVGVNMGDMDKAFGGVGYANRMDNSFKYATPNFSGFSAAVAYGTTGDIVRHEVGGVDLPTNRNRANWSSVGLKYENGPIGVGLSYDRQGAATDRKAVSSWNLTGAYDFEVVKLTLAVGQDRHGKMGWGSLGTSAIPLTGAALKAANITTADLFEDFKSTNYYLGLSAPLGGGTGAISWSHSRSNLGDSNKLDNDAKKQNIWAANYIYPLSKRTSVYGYVSYGTGLSYIDGLKGQEAGLGLNHKF